MVVDCDFAAVSDLVADGCSPKENWAIAQKTKADAAAKPKERKDFLLKIPFSGESILKPIRARLLDATPLGEGWAVAQTIFIKSENDKD